MNDLIHTDDGAVAASHTETARVGARILSAGGNAVDAVVAMIFAGTVVEGTLSTLGGGGFMLVDGPGLSGPVMLDFFARQPGINLNRPIAPWQRYEMMLPSKTLTFGTGPASVSVPGMAGGLARASRTYGKLPLSQVAAPAAELATSGVPLSFTQADEHELLYELLISTPEGHKTYHTPDGPRNTGQMFRQPDLAATIEEIAATSARSFYEGEIANRIVRWSVERGGRITLDDLAAFNVIDRVPLVEEIAGMRVYTNPAPSMGGPTIAELLPAMLVDVPDGETSDAVTARALVEVLTRLAPPLTVAPIDGAIVDPGEVSGEMREAMARAQPDEPPLARSPNTTHVCAIDGQGMVATATHSVGFGSGEFVPGTGIHLNNMLAEYDFTAQRPPGAPIPSMMAPTLVEGSHTTVALGSAGSDRIPQAIAQVLARMVRGDGLHGAMNAPRFVFDGSHIHCEPGFDPRTLELIEQRHGLVQWTDIDAYFGTVTALSHRAGKLAASGDRRREGAGIVL